MLSSQNLSLGFATRTGSILGVLAAAVAAGPRGSGRGRGSPVRSGRVISNTFKLESEAPQITPYAKCPRQNPPRRVDINPQQLVPKPRRKVETQAKVTSDRAAAFQCLAIDHDSQPLPTEPTGFGRDMSFNYERATAGR